MDINVLYEEIADELTELSKMKVGDGEYKAAVDGVTKLMDRAIEFEKLERQDKENAEKREEAKAVNKFDQDLKLRQADEEQKDRLVRNCIAVAGIVVPVVVTIWGTVKSFEFEREGTITTTMGRGFINKLLPKGKI